MNEYVREYYENRYAQTVHSANAVLALVLEWMPTVHSAVDVGCGVGTWLSVLQQRGVEVVHGVDGSWVDQDLLAIPRTAFTQVDLSTSVACLPRRYDLAISLEVAEHLPPERAAGFVSSLAALSDHVLFSAAIPFQGGTSHVNEQWQHYWVELFRGMGYVPCDFIRPRIWNDPRIPFWYRQNILLFSRQPGHRGALPDSVDRGPPLLPLDIVHPDLYMSRADTRLGVRRSFMLFRQSLGDYLRRAMEKLS